jgi:hypothetical protein
MTEARAVYPIDVLPRCFAGIWDWRDPGLRAAAPQSRFVPIGKCNFDNQRRKSCLGPPP